MDPRGAIAGNDHRARGGLQVKLALGLALVASVAQAAPPSPAAPPGMTAAPASSMAPGATAPLVQTTSTGEIVPPAPSLERVEPSSNARTAAWIATGVTALMVGAGVFCVVRMRQESDRANTIWQSNGDAADWTAASRAHDRWFHATLLFGGLTVVSAAVTGVLWSRAQPSYRFAVSPQGAYVGYARSF